MVNCLLVITKIVSLVLLIALGGILYAIYGTIYANGWEVKRVYANWVSALGTCTYPYNWTGDGRTYNKHCDMFATGFTITGICIIIVFAVKIYLIKSLWKLSCLSISVIVLSIVGSIGLIMVGQFPWDINDDEYGIGINIYHLTGSVLAIFFIALTEFIDAINWIKYMKYKKMKCHLFVILIHLYSFLCPLLSIIFGLIYGIYFLFGYNTTAIEAEWYCLLFLCLAILIQFIHLIVIHSHFTEEINNNDRNLYLSQSAHGNNEGLELTERE